MKPFKFSVAIALKNNKGEILAVRRPSHDDSLPNVWGLPAVTIRPSESPEEAAKRVGSEKLACTVEPVGFIGIKSAERKSFRLILMDIEAKVATGNPQVTASQTTATKYIEQKWTNDISVFKEAAQKGSLCSQILLDSAGFNYQAK